MDTIWLSSLYLRLTFCTAREETTFWCWFCMSQSLLNHNKPKQNSKFIETTTNVHNTNHETSGSASFRVRCHTKCWLFELFVIVYKINYLLFEKWWKTFFGSTCGNFACTFLMVLPCYFEGKKHNFWDFGTDSNPKVHICFIT